MLSELEFPLQDIITNNLDDMSPITGDNNQSIVSENLNEKEKKRKEYLHLVKATVAMRFEEFINNSNGMKLPPKRLQQLINDVETEYSLVTGSIKPSTIQSRLRRNNIVGIHSRRNPVLNHLEPLIVQWCLKMAEIGMSLNRTNVIELVNDMIKTQIFKQNI
jgi:uncharacterized protein YnzC (UPF0291/DUF896 family)